MFFRTPKLAPLQPHRQPCLQCSAVVPLHRCCGRRGTGVPIHGRPILETHPMVILNSDKRWFDLENHGITNNLSSAFPLGSQHLNGNIYRKYPSVQYLMDDFLWWKWGFSIAWFDYTKAIQSAHISSLNGFQWLEEANLGFLYGLFFDWNVKLQVCGCAPFLDKSIYTCHDCLNPADFWLQLPWIGYVGYVNPHKEIHTEKSTVNWSSCELKDGVVQPFSSGNPLGDVNWLIASVPSHYPHCWFFNLNWDDRAMGSEQKTAPLRFASVMAFGTWQKRADGCSFRYHLCPGFHRVSTWSGLNPFIQQEASNYRMFCDNLVW